MLIALPMFGDYYTPDLMSGLAEARRCSATRSTATCRAGRTSRSGAALTMLLALFLLVFMLYYLRSLRERAAGGGRA